ncbi:MAG TPA: trehalose-phosphatase [Thermomicrobiaceae bacterium]|nr:trehalose-phosphatase [Thermomicrobiaceae bacterium]
MTDRPNPASVLELAGRLATLLAARPAGLITDIDGTISRIAARPEAAVVEPEAIAALAELSRQLELVAAITGRSAEEAARMLAVPGVVVVGNHGLERLDLSGLSVADAARPHMEAIAAVMRELADQPPALGLVFEPKGASGSIHFRGATDPGAARAAILRRLEPLAARHGLRVTEGRMVLELRPPVAIDKGSALRDLVALFQLRSVVMLGDDVTDVDAMRALSRLRDAGGLAGCSVGVLAAETPAELLAAADVVIDGVESTVALLRELAQAGRHEEERA